MAAFEPNISGPLMRVLVLDNSVAPTGALLSALAFAEALGPEVSFVFVLPAGSSALDLVRKRGFESSELKMVEIGRSVTRILAYVPMLVLNGIRLRHLLTRERVDFVPRAGHGIIEVNTRRTPRG